jgi:hypothetical protein
MPSRKKSFSILVVMNVAQARNLEGFMVGYLWRSRGGVCPAASRRARSPAISAPAVAGVTPDAASGVEVAPDAGAAAGMGASACRS